MIVWAIDMLYPFPDASFIVPPSVTENLVAVLGTLKVSSTVVDAPIARGPTANGRVGLVRVTVPVPLRVRRVTWLMLTAWAAVKPVFVSWRFAVAVVPD